jgi:hypothetical protein
MTRLPRALACMALAWSMPAAASGQRIAGTVVDAVTGRPVAAAEVVLLNAGGSPLAREQTDSIGHFVFGPLTAAPYTLRAQRIGYAPVLTSRVALADGESVIVELRMGVDAIAVEPLVVTARNTVRAGRLREYYERLETHGKMGSGHFVTREDIDARPGAGTADLLRIVPGVNVVGRGRAVAMNRIAGGCDPAVFVDGTMMNRTGPAAVADYVTPEMIEGIEVYRGAAETPARYRDRGGCGTILIWTRAGRANGGRLNWKRVALGVSLIVGMIVLGR